MEFLILMGLIIVYLSLSSKISRITNNVSVQKNKKFSSLKELIGKNIEIETNDYFEYSFSSKVKGVLKEYNNTWIVIETITKKNKKELYFYRLNSITSIDVIDD